MAATRKKAMGKGLSALLNESGSVQTVKEKKGDEIVGSIAEIELQKIEVNPNQPRTQFDKEALEELASSVRELGIIQPITVRLLNSGKFQIISGERRYRAALKAELDSIPAYVRLADDQTMLEMALVENIQREELDSIEIALSYQRLIEECKLTQEAMSDRVGKKRSTITNYLRLLKLQPLIQAGLRDKMISMGHARALINVPEVEDQLELYQAAIEKERSVRQTEEAVRKLRVKKEPSPGETQAAPIPKFAEKQTEKLSKKLNTRVTLTRTKKGNGKIAIAYQNDEDLERIIALLKK